MYLEKRKDERENDESLTTDQGSGGRSLQKMGRKSEKENGRRKEAQNYQMVVYGEKNAALANARLSTHSHQVKSVWKVGNEKHSKAP